MPTIASILLAATVSVVSFPLAASATGAASSAERATTDGVVALQAEVMLLVALDAYADPIPSELVEVHDTWSSYMTGMDRGALIDWLTLVDAEGRSARDGLVAAGVTPPPDLDVALDTLSPAIMSALGAGEATGIDPAPYVSALQILNEGAFDVASQLPGTATVPASPSTQATSISEPVTSDAPGTGLAADADTTPPPASSAPSGDHTSDDTPATTTMAVVGTAALAAVGAAVALLRRARGRSDGGFDRLLEAGRRMTKALDRTEIARIAMTEAINLANATHGAFISVGASGMELLATSDDLFDGRRLGDGLLQRVADTGQPVNVVSHDEPSLTALPVALLGIPVIGSGRVTGIIALVRTDHHPFDDREDTIVSRLAPMVGSALAATERHDGITALSFVDPLTSLPNRRSLDRDIVEALASPGTVAVAMIDMDHFKNFNDTNGHGAGDEALRGVARALADGLRSGDRAYRYGGEEFSLLLRVRDADEAAQVAERLRLAVENAAIPGEHHQPGGRLTVSIGVALLPAGAFAPPPAVSLDAADAALYSAKSAGRNTVVVTEPVRV